MDSRRSATEQARLAIARYGGSERWQGLRLTLSPTSLTGFLPWLKGFGRTFTLPSRVELEPSRARAVFFDYPAAGSTGRFESGHVALDDAPLAEHRSTFAGAR